MTAVAWVLGAIATVAVLVTLGAVLRVLKRIDDEFSANTGHTFRDAIDRLEAIAERIEAGASTDRAAVAGVAQDLADQHERADAIEGLPGEASDAASRSPQ